MSTPSPALAPTPEEITARWKALATEGLTVPLAELPPGAPVLQTAFGFGTEVWATATPDPAAAEIDLRLRKVLAGRLVIGPDGRPATVADARGRGLNPYPSIPRV